MHVNTVYVQQSYDGVHGGILTWTWANMTQGSNDY